ncbi:MAG: FKBP-type peptidyl-prolyl cis-trans isomerase [Myxococcota bacterium]
MNRYLPAVVSLALLACSSKAPPPADAVAAATTTPATPDAGAATAAAADAAATPAPGPDAAAPAGDQLSTTAPPDVAAAPADATVTASGLAYKQLKKGTGSEKPHDYDEVSVYYVGWTTDGKSFDSAIPPAAPASFPLNRVIAGWTEGVQLMQVGDRFRFWIPEKLAYQGQQGAPAGMLVFDVELSAIKPGKKPIEAPPDVAAIPADATKTASGLAYKILTPGQGGEKPGPEDTVTVQFTGWTSDGKMIDSSLQHDRPLTIPLGRVPLAGWPEMIQLMEKGEKVRAWMPESIAYKGQPGAPAGTLVFEIELVSFVPAPKPIPAPADVAAPPADAQKTASGLAYKVLTPGKGGAKPTAASEVTVHYSGWTTDGKMFDSSVQRGEPATFPLGGVIAGWTEGLQLMEVGEKARFWIPEALAYKGRPGKPAGMLVFDVELLSIK